MRTSSPASSTPRMRVEHDCIGALEVPQNVYWGIHTQRAIENFTESGIPDGAHGALNRAYAVVKRACAIANAELGMVDMRKAEAIEQACEDIEHGALEICGRPRGDYDYIHPSDDVNHSQSTNDTYPAACKLAICGCLTPLAETARRLRAAIHKQADKHANVVKLGRTKLQDAVPMSFGQEFLAWATFL